MLQIRCAESHVRAVFGRQRDLQRRQLQLSAAATAYSRPVPVDTRRLPGYEFDQASWLPRPDDYDDDREIADTARRRHRQNVAARQLSSGWDVPGIPGYEDMNPVDLGRRQNERFVRNPTDRNDDDAHHSETTRSQGKMHLVTLKS